MSDLSATILRGTDQMSDAYTGLARVRATNRARKDAAIRAATESLGDAAKAWKQYGSWKDAKAAEADQQAALEAARLGRVHGGDAGELTALDGYRPSTLAGYQIATERRDAATKRAQSAGEAKYREVQMAHIQAQDTQATEKAKRDAEDATRVREGAAAAAKLWPDEQSEAPPLELAGGQIVPAPATLRALSPSAQMRQNEVRQIKTLMAADPEHAKDYMSRLVQLSGQARQEENDLRTEAAKQATETGKNARAAASRTIQQQNADTATARGEAYATHLKFDEENDAAGVRLRGEANQIAERSRQDRFAIAQNANNVAMARTLGQQFMDEYDADLKAIEEDFQTLNDPRWRTDEQKAAAASGLEQMKRERVQAKSRLLDVLKTLPQPGPMQRGGGGPAPVVAPHEMSDADLDAAIKAAEGK